ncbi:MAG TPA: hypothetical protein VNV43_14690 [Candidatus Acidoferrales bacterium]|nr:hypothetical protein [Candidatus Acidoferrales bacterium]
MSNRKYSSGLAGTFLLVTLVPFLLPIASSAHESYLDDGVIKIGVDSTKGGSITWLSLSGSSNNIVNSYDLGREVQQSYYAGPKPYDPSNNVNPGWKNWPWNPIQSGDSYGHESVVLAQSNDGRTLYVKCRPMQWALNNVPGQCTLESWITLANNVAIVSNRLVNMRTDTAQHFHGADQELPAVYTVGTLSRLISYAGDAPFTGDALTNLADLPPPWQYWNATESWAALVDSHNWGLGVYNPGSAWFVGGFAGTPGVGGPHDNPTGYIAPIKYEILDTNIVYTYTYDLIVGTVSQIRDWVYSQPRRPGFNFVFNSDRCGWTYNLTTDAGWPVTNYVTVSLDSSDPQMCAPRTAFYATNMPTVYIRAAYQIGQPAGRAFGQVFWETDGIGSWSEARSVTFPVVADGQFHTYAVNLAASKNYKGLITQFRFDPAYNGRAGDLVKVAAISSSPIGGSATGQ